MNDKNICIILCMFFLVGCADRATQDTYSDQEAQSAYETVQAVIIKREPITIQGGNQGIGLLAGGIAGASLGQLIGKESGRTLAAGIGALGGMAAGNAINKNMNKKQAWKYLIRIAKTGSEITIIQEDKYAVNQTVSLMLPISGSGARARIVG